MTGRSQLMLMAEDKELELGLQAYQETTTAEPASTNQRYIEMVNRVGQRIAAAADRPDYQWEFRVIASPQQNAFCLPGGKVAVYEGILPVCDNEAGLAVVMSHEVAHALARHGGERMSHQMVVSGAQTAVDYVTRKRDEREREWVMKAYGLGTQYGFVLPYSRKHESEADSMGLMLMAKAGYDPTEAVRFWQRFATAKDQPAPPEFLSTHPADERRSAELAELLTEARPIYEAAPQKLGLGEPIMLMGTAPPVAQMPTPPAQGAPPTAASFNAFPQHPPVWQ
ncbi:MAG: M48 family metallopeptidase [Planctomycetales bacterium]|nr:M48 family metallopeptidase [Planctomycetales bacterium]